ncbi:MAG TPA: glycosyltransferase family 4 protein [Candidatus Sulfotelmatobacter sp.]|jgi:glycosyltransferase involved in cell wall biosynthesis|nr:glycosyltransferase family 4 protein [Candidatus Sulfotelmatobacter sp.]
MVERTLKILAPTRYPWRFNSPRNSRHDISIRSFLPANYISNAIEGVTVLNPWPPRRFDLVHAFNRLPIGGTPYLISFESHLPRGFGLESSWLFKAMRRSLASGRCRSIVAISDYARRQFLRQHADTPEGPALEAKLTLRYPNFPMPQGPDPFLSLDDGDAGQDDVRVVFVGNHFGRKGGSVAVRMAELALQHEVPLRVDIVSAMEVGAASWTDPTSPGYFDRDHALLKLPNVRHHGKLANKEVLHLIGRAHFVLLPTFSDSFGYSAIEAMANHTPVVATAQGALPEFIHDGENGILVSLDTDDVGEWVHIGHPDRGSAAYAALYRAEVDRLAEESLDKVWRATRDKTGYLALRRNARQTAERTFSADDANRFWDDYYCRLA